MMHPISFTAIYRDTVPISKISSSGELEDQYVNVVELEKDSDNDIDTMFEVADAWRFRGFNYAYEILNEAIKDCNYQDVEKEHIYAITTQKDDFDKLNPKKILGLSVFSETIREENELSWLQVDPYNTNKNAYRRKYKGVGKAMVDYIKNTHFDKTIYVQSAIDAVDFYKKQGFVQRDESKPCSFYY